MGALMKAKEVKQALGITRMKLRMMEETGALKRVHVKFRWRGGKYVAVDHGWFKRVDVEALAGG
jgi:hypothetical protein